MPFTVVGGNANPTNIIDLWLDYTSKRGLTPDILAPMGGELLSLEQIYKGNYGFSTSIFGPAGDGGIGGFVFPVSEGEYQVRVLYDPTHMDAPKPGASIKKKGKYFRPSGSANVLYFPPHITDWRHPEAKYDLLIVEGALNAVRLAAEGFHTVAIQGVSSFRIQGKTSPIIPQLADLAALKQVQKVIYVPDSDTGDLKPDLLHQVNTLCLELMKLRPDRQDTVFVCRPPANTDGTKNGADDYLNKVGPNEFTKMLLENSVRFSDNKYLKIQKESVLRYIYNESTDEWWDEKLRIFIVTTHLNNHLKGYGLVEDIFFPRSKPIYYSNDRLRSAPALRIAEGIKYKPDLDESFFPENDELGTKWYINKYNPHDIPKAIKGDVAIWYEVLHSLCRNSPAAIPKIVAVLAKHAQEPALMPKYALLFTGEKGASKSNMAKCIGLALSKRFHSARVNPETDFNDDWRGYACKEWAEFDVRMDEEWLKDLITSATYTVNGKHKSIYTEDNHTLNIFTCNTLKSKIQEGDRRFIIAGYALPDNKNLGLRFEEWLNGPGPNYLRYHLLYECDASEYDRIDVHTEMTDEVVNASKSYKASVKDEILEELSQWPELECVPNPAIDELLRKHDIKLLSFLKEFGRDFHIPAKAMVKIDGIVTRFRYFKNPAKWSVEVDTNEYRKQALLATRFITGRKY